MNKEKGFILPLTCCFVFLFLSLIMHQVSVYLSEVRFYQEGKQSYRLENVLTLGIYDAKEILQQKDITNTYKETKVYPHGKVVMTFSPVDTTGVKVELACDNGNEYRRTVTYYYDKIDEKLYVW